MLIHLVDVSGSEGRDPVEDFKAINAELKEYSADLAARPQIVAANKCDLLGDDRSGIDRLKKCVDQLGYRFFELSAVTHAGTRELVNAAAELLAQIPPVGAFEADYVKPEPVIDTSAELSIDHDGKMWYLDGPWLQKLVASVNFGDNESLLWFDRILRDAGVYQRMEALGCKDGDMVNIYDITFEYKE